VPNDAARLNLVAFAWLLAAFAVHDLVEGAEVGAVAALGEMFRCPGPAKILRIFAPVEVVFLAHVAPRSVGNSMF
jgi:hypothetical protein